MLSTNRGANLKKRVRTQCPWKNDHVEKLEHLGYTEVDAVLFFGSTVSSRGSPVTSLIVNMRPIGSVNVTVI